MNSLLTERPLVLRQYQKELVEHACRGYNVAICAPTGTGKTVIAAFIARNHIYNALKTKSHYKVCFLVPTNNLVQQQEKILREYLGHCSMVKGISGSSQSSDAVEGIIRGFDVIVITPQIILNLLSQNQFALSGTKFPLFDISIFTLVIFDEAHHTRDQHPYNMIMEHYHDLRLLKTLRPREKLPQIIGMTASLGTGGNSSKNLDQAIDYTLSICANMDICRISSVRKNRQNLAEYLPHILDDIRYVDLVDFKQLQFFRTMHDEVGYYRKAMMLIPEAMNGKLYLQLTDPNNLNPLHCSFISWACPFKNFLATADMLSQNSHESLNFYVEQMLILYDSLVFLRLFGTEPALDLLESRQSYRFALRTGELINRVQDTLNKLKALNVCSHTSPMLQQLISILNDQFKENPKSRVLIFLQKREFCLALSEILKGKTCHSISYLTGLQSQDGGQSAKEQLSTIKDFDDGKISILCATTVAEEGLDIFACNLVIQYNHVTNEIARVQRRGRGRAMNAKSILITCELFIKDKEEQNKILENLMNSALDEINQFAPGEFESRVQQLVDELNRKRLEKRSNSEQAAERQKALTKDCDYFILCRECRSPIGMSDKLVLVSNAQYVLADGDFWTKVSVSNGLDSKLSKLTDPILGKHYCAKVRNSGICKNRLGQVVRFQSVYLPIISLSGVVFVKTQYKGQKQIAGTGHEYIMKKKWDSVKKSLFGVEQITNSLLNEMRNAPNQPSYLTNKLMRPASNEANIINDKFANNCSIIDI